MVTLFLERGADANTQNKSGSSALHRAATESHDSTVRVLVGTPWKAKPNITKKDVAGKRYLPTFIVNGWGPSSVTPSSNF